MGGGPRPGDAISFHPGVHGSDPLYGHVAIVEEVKPDGSIVISQSGTGWMAVVVETISKQKLDAMGSGVDFIH
jgi:surface antigen